MLSSSPADPSVDFGKTGDADRHLVRAIGRWTLTALVLNGVIGSGIFGLPGAVAKLVGPTAPLAYVLAALAIGVLTVSFAEVGSQFRETGGQYLYARHAFGRFAGVQIGWFTLLVRLTSAGAVINLFVNYLAEFWPAATTPVARAAVMFAIVGGLAFVNCRGVRPGAGLSNFFIVTKLASLIGFVIAGMILMKHVAPLPLAEPATAGDWTDALLILVFAFGGFETALIPAAETRNPQHDAPFALGVGLVTVAIVYLAIHFVTMWSVPDLANSTRPLADAARAFAGPTGAVVMALAALLSAFGWLSGAFVAVPRLIFAMAEQRDFPVWFAAIHKRFRSPHLAVLLWAVLVLALGIYGSFIWNAVLAAVARLATYASTCGALIQLRRREPDAIAWRAPAGNLLAVLGIAFCGVLALRMTASHFAILAVVGAIATINWLVVRHRT